MARSKRRGVVRGQLTFNAAMSPGEITRNLPKPGEGFTIRTTGPGVGRPARDALSVGFAPTRGRSAEVTITGDGSPKSIYAQMRHFNDTNLDVLGAPGASMAHGGWVDPDTGKVEQDTSVLLPRTREGMRAAMHIGVESQQAAIGNLGTKKYLGDINIPHYLQRGQYEGPQGHEPLVENAGVSDSGRQRVRITPGRQEMIDVEADIASERLKFKDKPVKEKGAAQYVKESLSFLRRTRQPARPKTERDIPVRQRNTPG